MLVFTNRPRGKVVNPRWERRVILTLDQKSLQPASQRKMISHGEYYFDVQGRVPDLKRGSGERHGPRSPAREAPKKTSGTKDLYP